MFSLFENRLIVYSNSLKNSIVWYLDVHGNDVSDKSQNRQYKMATQLSF